MKITQENKIKAVCRHRWLVKHPLHNDIELKLRQSVDIVGQWSTHSITTLSWRSICCVCQSCIRVGKTLSAILYGKYLVSISACCIRAFHYGIDPSLVVVIKRRMKTFHGLDGSHAWISPLFCICPTTQAFILHANIVV